MPALALQGRHVVVYTEGAEMRLARGETREVGRFVVVDDDLAGRLYIALDQVVSIKPYRAMRRMEREKEGFNGRNIRKR